MRKKRFIKEREKMEELRRRNQRQTAGKGREDETWMKIKKKRGGAEKGEEEEQERKCRKRRKAQNLITLIWFDGIIVAFCLKHM